MKIVVITTNLFPMNTLVRTARARVLLLKLKEEVIQELMVVLYARLNVIEHKCKG